MPRVSKAEYAAYEAQLVDPYADFFVYPEGLTRANLDRFFAGDGGAEPPIDVLVEETDNIELKVVLRQAARERRVDVLMMTDFGDTAELMWNYFCERPDSPIGCGAPDADLLEALAATRTGDRETFWTFVEALCGPDFVSASLVGFVEGRGEQPTSSMPQSGATAMASGAIGGKELALHVLGHHRGAASPCRVVYDLRGRTAATWRPG